MTWTDPRAYERLARAHHAGVYSYLRWLCRDADLAEDLTQATFVQIWLHPPEFRGHRALRAWVYRVARNEFLQHRRRAGVETVPLDDETLGDDGPSVGRGFHAAPKPGAAGRGRACPERVEGPALQEADPQVALERSELRDAVRKALDRLPDLYREVIVLHNLEGVSLHEVAVVLEIPVGTVKSRRAKAFALLREMLVKTVTLSECEGSPTAVADE